MNVVTIEVFGKPVGQGSMRAFKHPATSKVVTTHSNPQGLSQWRSDIQQQALDQIPVMHYGPVKVWIEFRFGRPQRNPSPSHTTRPDIDKLARAVLDALSTVAYKDDSQVVELRLRKRYAEPDERPGALIQIGLEER